MSVLATQIQAKAMELLKAWYGTRFKTYRLTPMLQVQPGDLPILGVYILREQRVREQANQSEPYYDATLTLGISGGVHVETDKQNDQPALEDMMNELDKALLEDAKFVVMSSGIPSVDRVAQFAKVGETTLYEIRMEMTLQYQSWHHPRVVDDFKSVKVTTQFPDKQHVDDGTQQIERVYEVDVTTRAKPASPQTEEGDHADARVL